MADVTIHGDLIQGSDEWLAARCGMITASDVHNIITPSGKPAKNEKMRAYAYDLLAQRITGYVDPRYVSDDMLRGADDEHDARQMYSKNYAPVAECGFIVRDFGGFRLGYSPDGLVGDDGVIECKSRRAKLHVKTILDDGMPAEHAPQVQTGLLVSGRKWCDYVSWSGGLPMAVYRVETDHAAQSVILGAVEAFEEYLADALEMYQRRVSARRFYPTQRRVDQEMVI